MVSVLLTFTPHQRNLNSSISYLHPRKVIHFPMEHTALLLDDPRSTNTGIEDLSIQVIGTIEWLLVHEATFRKVRLRDTRANHIQILRRHKTKHYKLGVISVDQPRTKVSNPIILVKF